MGWKQDCECSLKDSTMSEGLAPPQRGKKLPPPDFPPRAAAGAGLVHTCIGRIGCPPACQQERPSYLRC
jgi:hypothetical protein